MKLKHRISSLLVLLFVGSASLWAQGEDNHDPFPDVMVGNYQGNMTMMAKVMKGNVELTNAILAVYVDDVIRGKERVGSGTDPTIAYVMVYGNYTGEPQYLQFKVYVPGTTYASGTTYDVTPKTPVQYQFNGSLGSKSAPYVVNIGETPALSLTNDGDNNQTIVNNSGITADVTLEGRTLFKDGKWNTICLPFSVSIEGSPLDGATARELTAASITGSTLNLTFGNAVTSLQAGKPYIIKWASGDDIVSPMFTGVTLSNADLSFDNAESGDLRVRFMGTYKRMVFADADLSILLMREDNYLRYPQSGASLGAQHAFFKIGDDVTTAPRLTSFVIDYGDAGAEATGIIAAPNEKVLMKSENWFMLDGRRLSSKPVRRGLYIHNGCKTLIK